MSLPDAARLMRVVEATWPAAATRACGPFTLRDGQGGGSRVSAATLFGTATRDQIAEAAAAMRTMGQPALFQVRAGQEGFDAELAALGYAAKDATVLDRKSVV